MSEPIRLLIVDDEPLMKRKIGCFTLSKHGYEIVGEAENGAQALALVERLKPDIVVADIGMPVMNGLEMLQLIQSRRLPAKVIMLTCYEDFSMAQSAIRLGAVDYITKLMLQEEDLLKSLDKAANLLLEERNSSKRTIRFLLHEMMLFHSEHSLRQLSDVSFHPRKFALLTIQAGSEADKWLAASHTQLEMNDRYRSFVVRMPDKKWCVLFFSFEENDANPFYSWCSWQCSSIRATMEKVSGQGDYLMSLSTPRSRMEKLPSVYRESNDLLNAGFYSDKRALLHEHDYRLYTGGADESIIAATEAIRYAVSTRDCSEAAAGICNWIDMAVQLQPHPDRVRKLGKEIIDLIVDPVGGMEFSNETSLSEYKLRLKEKLAGSLVFADVSELLESLVKSLSHSLQSASMRNEIKKAIRYIHNHYQEIDLVSAARHINLSPSWFKTLFRKETGQSFRDYVQSYKLEMAKQLLASTDMKVYEVANAVGIPNTRYFTRLFTKCYLMSPVDYRKKKASALNVL